MGLPEVVDFARNFSVMVRIQGPDPKGLKMQKHAFHHYNSGRTTLSASGMLLPGSLCTDKLAKEINRECDMQLFPRRGLVLTVASIIEPFLSQQHKENISQTKPALIPGVQIDIMVEGTWLEQKDKVANHWHCVKVLKLLDIPASAASIQSLIEASSGSYEYDWEVGWSLASNHRSPHVSDVMQQVEQSSSGTQNQMVRIDSRNPSLMGKLTTRIVLLGVSSVHFEGLPNLKTSSVNKRGHLLVGIGSPFGILSPVHFFNSVSLGAISNCYPPNSTGSALLMADIRCLPGMEGCPVFGENSNLIGILTKPLRQRSTRIELQMVIPWEAIASACSDLLLEKPPNEWEEIQYNTRNLNAGSELQFSSLNSGKNMSFHDDHPNSKNSSLSPIEKAMASTCLVANFDGSWASGILLNKQGLILTNAHLLEPWRFRKAAASCETDKTKQDAASPQSFGHIHSGQEKLIRNQFLLPKVLDNEETFEYYKIQEYVCDSTVTSQRDVRVRLDCADPWIWCDARVLYVSKGPLDVALLQLKYVPHQLCPIVMNFPYPSPGSIVYVIGHGLFGARCESPPSSCVGVIAKVVEAKKSLPCQSLEEVNGRHFPAMIETTAAVHPGSSGGAVINSNGHMIGLVTSNARHGGGTLIPHLNFSIPCAALEPIFKFSKDMQQTSLLEDLDKPNENLSSLWALMPSLAPKPDPLPSMPPILQGDDDKEARGSRFAKFIAETHNWLKKQPEKQGESRPKPFPSKL